jgi:predicted short-subunit dehydrogenase-like oxidoreductase (DUF2520 family)
MKVIIIGSGNVATVLGRKMLLAGHEIKQVISRNKEHAALLADELNCGYALTFDAISKDADLYIIAIFDSELIEMDKKLFLDKKLVVHTAGSFAKDVLKNVSRNYGVLYPLQSLRKEIKEIHEMPLLVDANTEDNLTLIYDFAKTISDKVEIAGDEERLKLHVGAIIVNNFANHLYALTEDYCKKENIDFKLLLPLINGTTSRLNSFSPGEVQTGPAARNDNETIQKHIALLSGYPDLKKIYEVMTESIIGM